MKLISLREFVLKESSRMAPIHNWSESIQESLTKICNYAKFLSRPLELGMFVPCDLEGNVLTDPEKPKPICRDCADEWSGICKTYHLPCDPEKAKIAYNEAKSRVIFEGFEICDRLESVKCVVNGGFHFSYESAIKSGKKIESLVINELTLTETARKEIGL